MGNATDCREIKLCIHMRCGATASRQRSISLTDRQSFPHIWATQAKRMMHDDEVSANQIGLNNPRAYQSYHQVFS